MVQKRIEFPPEQAEEVQKFADACGESFRVVLHALRRHLKYPPRRPTRNPPSRCPTARVSRQRLSARKRRRKGRG